MAVIDTRYRFYSDEELQALKTSALLIIKTVETVGQSHGISGRSHTAADYDKAKETVANINAAIQYNSDIANAGWKGAAIRYTNMNNGGCGY